MRTFAAASIMTLAMTACTATGGDVPGSDSPQPETSSSAGYPSAGPSTGTTPLPAGTFRPPSDTGSSGAADSPGTAAGTPNPGAVLSAGQASLRISIKPSTGAPAQEFTLDCTGAQVGKASTLPNAEAACARVLELGGDFFRPQPDANRTCTQQYGGPQTADITGTVNGQPVTATFSRTDGCQIARWNTLAPVLGTGGAS